MERKKIFYGWWIVVASTIILAFMWTFPISSFGLFIGPISANMQTTRASISLCSTIISIVAMLISPFSGKLIEKLDARVVMSVSMVLVALGFFVYSLAPSIWIFYVGATLIGLGLNGSSIMAISIIVKNWFVEKRGLATSIALAGSGLGGMLLSPVLIRIIDSMGWRFTYRILALVVLCLLPLVILVIRKKPEEKGLTAYGASKTTETAQEDSTTDFTAQELKKKSFFWIYAISCLFIGFSAGSVLLQMPTFLGDIGYNKAIIGNIVSFSLAVAIPGKIILGKIFDSKGSKVGVFLGNGTLVLCILFLLLSKNMAFLILFAFFHGIGTCSGTVTPSVLTSRLFGASNYGEIYGNVNVFLQLGLAIGSPLSALISDKTNNYTPAWILCLIVSVLALLGMLYTIQATKKAKESLN